MHLPGNAIALISRPKLALLRHVGVLLPDGHVAHCTPERGEHVSTVEEFAADHDVKLERLIPKAEQLSTLQRVAAAMAAPQSYNLFTNNCETFAHRSIGEPAKSPQLAGVAFLLGLGLLAAFSSN